MSALRECVGAWEESEADYFLKSYGLHASLDLHSFTWKMSQASLFEEWTESQQSWPRMGMTIDGECYRLMMWERATFEKGSGSSLPTPTASPCGSNTSPNSTNKRLGLSQLANKGLLPTPVASDWKRSGSPSDLGRKSPCLPAMVGGLLNPQFVEEIMGLPIDSTELEPWEMAGCQPPRAKRFKGSLDLRSEE